jgi:hypothetical protein
MTCRFAACVLDLLLFSYRMASVVVEFAELVDAHSCVS